MDLLIATGNPNKLREIREVLGARPIRLLSLADIPAVDEPDETGATFEENARLKARYYAAAADALARPDLITVAEDSGLEIDALGGEPGVRSARFLRPEASYPERFAEIHRRLAFASTAPRTARFVCALSAVQHGGIVFETRGVVEGVIADAPRGSGGFGYDPIFYFPEYRETLAEVSQARKLQVAHRGKAFRAFGEWLDEHRTEN